MVAPGRSQGRGAGAVPGVTAASALVVTDAGVTVGVPAFSGCSHGLGSPSAGLREAPLPPPRSQGFAGAGRPAQQSAGATAARQGDSSGGTGGARRRGRLRGGSLPLPCSVREREESAAGRKRAAAPVGWAMRGPHSSTLPSTTLAQLTHPTWQQPGRRRRRELVAHCAACACVGSGALCWLAGEVAAGCRAADSTGTVAEALSGPGGVEARRTASLRSRRAGQKWMEACNDGGSGPDAPATLHECALLAGTACRRAAARQALIVRSHASQQLAQALQHTAGTQGSCTARVTIGQPQQEQQAPQAVATMSDGSSSSSVAALGENGGPATLPPPPPPPANGSELDAASAADAISVAEDLDVGEPGDPSPQPVVNLDITDAAISQELHLAAGACCSGRASWWGLAVCSSCRCSLCQPDRRVAARGKHPVSYTPTPPAPQAAAATPRTRRASCCRTRATTCLTSRWTLVRWGFEESREGEPRGASVRSCSRLPPLPLLAPPSRPAHRPARRLPHQAHLLQHGRALASPPPPRPRGSGGRGRPARRRRRGASRARRQAALCQV